MATPLNLITSTPATIFRTGNLTTTAIRYPDAASSALTKHRHVIVSNKHASAVVGVGLFSVNTASPVLGAGAAGAADAAEVIPVFGASRLELDITSDLAVWIVASAGSTPVSVMAFDSDI